MTQIGRGAPDLLHDTYYRSGSSTRRGAAPLAVTIYDMTPELFPELFTGGKPHANKRAYVERAALVLCISESTRRDLTRLYGAIAAPTVVTHLAVGSRFAPGATPRPGHPPARTRRRRPSPTAAGSPSAVSSPVKVSLSLMNSTRTPLPVRPHEPAQVVEVAGQPVHRVHHRPCRRRGRTPSSASSCGRVVSLPDAVSVNTRSSVDRRRVGGRCSGRGC